MRRVDLDHESFRIAPETNIEKQAAYLTQKMAYFFIARLSPIKPRRVTEKTVKHQKLISRLRKYLSITINKYIL